MEHRRHNNALLRPIDFVHYYIRQSRDGPFKRAWIVTDMAHERKRNQQLGAAKQPVHHGLRGGRAILRKSN
jgi:hypothetical protein